MLTWWRSWEDGRAALRRFARGSCSCSSPAQSGCLFPVPQHVFYPLSRKLFICEAPVKVVLPKSGQPDSPEFTGPAAPMGRARKLRRSGSGRGEGNSGEESVKFEAKPPEQKPGFDDLNETKYGKKQEKLSKLGLRAGELKEIEDDPELAGMLDVRIAQHPNPCATT